MTRLDLQLAAALLFSGCMTAEASFEQDGTGESEVGQVEQAQRAITMAGAVAPGEFAGDCEKGMGWYLSADNETATLTVYVLTPAERGVFSKPTVRLTTLDHDAEDVEINEFETVELEAGQSRVFTAYAGTQLMDASAEIIADVVPD